MLALLPLLMGFMHPDNASCAWTHFFMHVQFNQQVADTHTLHLGSASWGT